MPSGILVHPTVGPQYANVTDRTDRQRSDSIGRTVLQTVAQKTAEPIEMQFGMLSRVSPGKEHVMGLCSDVA